MEAGRSPSSDGVSAGQLWQWPAFFLGMFAMTGAAFVVLKPRVGPGVDERFTRLGAIVDGESPEASIAPLNRLLKDTTGTKSEARVHAMLAEAIDRAQIKATGGMGTGLLTNNSTILTQGRLALEQGYKPDQAWFVRMAKVAESLERPKEAFELYQKAMVEKPLTVAVNRHVVELAATAAEPAESERILSRFLEREDLTPADKSWGVLRRVELLLAAGQYEAARAMLLEIEKATNDGSPGMTAGLVQCKLGEAFYKLGDSGEAERRLRLARQMLTVASPEDASAAAMLGDVLLARGDAGGAESFYQDILTTHPDAPAADWARAGRGLCRLMKGEEEPGLADMDAVVRRQAENPPTHRQHIEPAKLAERLAAGSATLAARHSWPGAIELLTQEKKVVPTAPAAFWLRAAGIYERYGDSEVGVMPATVPTTSPAKVTPTVSEGAPTIPPKARQLLKTAGDAYFTYSMAVTLADDKAAADALWHAIELYDRAGDTRTVCRALDRFSSERPESPQAPEALLRLGRGYQALGEWDKAVATFQRLQLRYEQSLAASKSLVPLAQVFVAQGPDYYARAERMLIGVLENNRQLTPQAEEFRAALFELARLYYRTERYEESIGRLDELLKRYPPPADNRQGQVLFFMADGYRKSATMLAAGTGMAEATVEGPAEAGAPKVASVSTAAAAQAVSDDRKEELRKTVRSRLGTAKAHFEDVIEWYRAHEPADDLERLHLKLAFFYRADCAYDLQQYDEAVHLYDRAAFKYQDDASSLAAWVQVVNALVKQGKIEEARAANERAKHLLKRMPAEAFNSGGSGVGGGGGYSLSRAYWESWLKWTGESGIR